MISMLRRQLSVTAAVLAAGLLFALGGLVAPVFGQGGPWANAQLGALYDLAGNFRLGFNATGGAAGTGGVQVGTAGSTFSQVLIIPGAITPAASSASVQTTEQTFTYTGLATTDKVFLINSVAPTSLCPPTTVRVSAANTLAIGFTTLTASACTPAAGTYTVVAIR